ncbi:MAG TPA: phosphatase [Pseudohongiella sp.]|nr:phosphatase [Pseudohongiella sp.]HBX36765.1 phosphatase [Pseudohongiella sp.]|tara:strand:+ start:34 stop:609 length:576 start_codon:yes stop_codon:yes gene_type:complete
MKRKMIMKFSGALLGVLMAASVTAQSTLSDVLNLREYSDTFASAGQPTAEQFEAIRDAGYERVIYIAFTTNDNALANADQVVKGLGMDYLHIPVDWNNPTKRDFYAFADAMQRNPEQKTLLHCQVNARATAFSFMYRVVYEGVPVAEAKADMNSVWQPNETWRDLIFDVLADHDISPECEGCDWTPSQVGG